MEGRDATPAAAPPAFAPHAAPQNFATYRAAAPALRARASLPACPAAPRITTPPRSLPPCLATPLCLFELLSDSLGSRRCQATEEGNARRGKKEEQSGRPQHAAGVAAGGRELNASSPGGHGDGRSAHSTAQTLQAGRCTTRRRGRISATPGNQAGIRQRRKEGAISLHQLSGRRLLCPCASAAITHRQLALLRRHSITPLSRASRASLRHLAAARASRSTRLRFHAAANAAHHNARFLAPSRGRRDVVGRLERRAAQPSLWHSLNSLHL